jgi:hypothetical protein
MPEEDPPPYAWLDPDKVATWVKVDTDADNADSVELARQAAASWVEDQRPDLNVTTTVADVEVITFTPTERVVLAGVIATGRLLSRAGNLSGLVNYGEFAGAVLRSDPDVRQMLGRPRPVIG